MKELSIEEKAEHYDEAIKRLEDIKTGKCQKTFMYTEGLFDYLFPELKYEDERLWLIKFIQEEIDCLCFDVRDNDDRIKLENLRRSLSWLEKQGENKPDISDELFDHRYTQKLVEMQRQTRMIQWKGNNLKEVIEFTGKDRNFDKWFKSFAEYEKYVHAHDNIFKIFTADGSYYEVPVGAWIVKTPDGCNVASKAIFVQKPAWSEEDEKMIEAIEALCDDKIRFTEFHDVKGYAYTIKNWLKSLKDRYTWKPSEEQMSVLKEQCVCKKSTVAGAVLCELFHDLKKLKTSPKKLSGYGIK